MSIRPSFPAKQSPPQGVVIAGRPAFFHVGLGADRYGNFYTTTFLFADEAKTRPIGWQRGELTFGDTFKDGGGAVWVLTEELV